MELFTIIGILVVALIILFSVETEAFNLAGAALIVAGAYTLYSVGFMETLTWTIGHIPMLLGYAAVYFAAGFAWSFFKWDRYVARDVRNKRADNWSADKIKSYALKWTDHKAKLAAWTVWFPFSVVGYVVGDLLRDFVRFVQEFFGNIYQRIANRHYAGL